MADYKAIKGHYIQTVAGDPDPLEVGDIWYSSTTKKIRGAKLPAGTWATGGNVNTGGQSGGGCGLQTAAIFVGRYTNLGNLTNVELYDGTSWTESPASHSVVGREHAAVGTQTAAIKFGGKTPPNRFANAETWNGSTWTEVGDMNTARSHHGASGGPTGVTGALCISGYSTAAVTIVEEWNGTSWTEIADVSHGVDGASAFGTTTAAIFVGGPPAECESWNGTSWTEVSNLVTAGRTGFGASGIQTDGLISGGNASPHNYCEQWDGSSWTEVADLPSARAYDQSAAGNIGTKAVVSFGGGAGAPYPVATAEWTAAVTASSFTSS